MKTDVMIVSGNGRGMDAALALAAGNSSELFVGERYKSFVFLIFRVNLLRHCLFLLALRSFS